MRKGRRGLWWGNDWDVDIAMYVRMHLPYLAPSINHGQSSNRRAHRGGSDSGADRPLDRVDPPRGAGERGRGGGAFARTSIVLRGMGGIHVHWPMHCIVHTHIHPPHLAYQGGAAAVAWVLSPPCQPYTRNNKTVRA